MQQTHTRLWWMEVLRGIVALSFGLLFIILHVRFFIYTLGIYLVIDGSLDIYKVAKGNRASKRKVLSYLGSALGILLGLICFVFHVLTILFILLLTIPSHIKGTPPPWQQRGWRAMHELTLTWDKMLKDMRTLFISMGHRLTKRQVS